MFGGFRTYLIGYHNPVVHGYYVIKAWKKIYGSYPNCREFICILLHDIGYVQQREGCLNKIDDHPNLGAKICSKLFGEYYYLLIAGHSRDYAKKIKIELSALCYADKYAVMMIPLGFHRFIGLCDNDSWNKGIIEKYRKDCELWWNKNGWEIKS